MEKNIDDFVSRIIKQNTTPVRKRKIEECFIDNNFTCFYSEYSYLMNGFEDAVKEDKKEMKENDFCGPRIKEMFQKKRKIANSLYPEEMRIIEEIYNANRLSIENHQDENLELNELYKIRKQYTSIILEYISDKACINGKQPIDIEFTKKYILYSECIDNIAKKEFSPFLSKTSEMTPELLKRIGMTEKQLKEHVSIKLLMMYMPDVMSKLDE